MKQRKLVNNFKEYDNDGNLVNETTVVALELTPDDGKCFVDPQSGEKIIRQSDGKGAVIEIPEDYLSLYKEVSIID